MSYPTSLRFLLVLSLAALLVACSGGSGPGLSGGTTVGSSGAGGGSSGCPTGGAPPAPATEVPCPTDTALHCEQWYGESFGGMACFAEDDAAPPASFGDCLRVNPGVVPAEFCCPSPAEQAPPGVTVGLPACADAVVPCPGAVNGLVPEAADCLAFDDTGAMSVPRCLGTDPNLPPYDGPVSAYECDLDPSWGRCGVYSPTMLCCAQ